MRTLASTFHLTARAPNSAGRPVSLALAAVDRWLSTNLAGQSRRRDVAIKEDCLGTAPDEVYVRLLSQNADFGGKWETEIVLTEAGGAPGSRIVLASLVMRLKQLKGTLTVPRFKVFPPRLLLALQDEFDLFINEERVDGAPFTCCDSGSIEKLIELMRSPVRSVPLVVLVLPSPINSRELVVNSLAKRLLGFASVALVPSPLAEEFYLQSSTPAAFRDIGAFVYWPTWEPFQFSKATPVATIRTLARISELPPQAISSAISGRVFPRIAAVSAMQFRQHSLILDRLKAHSNEAVQTVEELSLARQLIAEQDAEIKLLEGLLDTQTGEVSTLKKENEELKRTVTLLIQKAERTQHDQGESIRDPSRSFGSIEEMLREASSILGDSLHLESVELVQTHLDPNALWRVLLALAELNAQERLGRAKNLNELVRHLLSKLGAKLGKLAIGETGVRISVDGRLRPANFRLHLQSGKPEDTESVYWLKWPERPIDKMRYHLAQIGRHA